MFSLYLFALIVGGALLLFSLFGGSEHSDSDLGHDGAHSPAQWLSIRTAIYFLFVFGGIGTILTLTWPPATMPLILGISVAAGVGIGAAVSAAFAYLRKTESGYRSGDESFIGLSAVVTLPIGPGRVGKVLVRRGDRTFELLAQPYDRTAGSEPPAAWKEVIIIEMARGTAVVAPVDDPAVRELASVNQL
ncbi:MAG: hypothetical protein ACREOK_09595 [Gemmatimonadaceae bacterium]